MRMKRTFVIAICLLTAVVTKAQDSLRLQTGEKDSHGYARPYTSLNPLVYEDLWDLEPYAYLDTQGRPNGYNVDLVRLIMEKLGIPYVIKLKNTPQNFIDVRDGKADLTVGMKAFYHDQYASYSNNVIALFTHSVAFPREKDFQVRELKDLKGKKVIVHENSFSHNLMKREGLGDYAIPLKDMKKALIEVSENGEGIVLWNTMTMKTIVNKYNLSNIRLTSVNMKYGEYHFMSNDSLLLAQIDSIYDEITTNEEILEIRKKWFYDEDDTYGLPSWLWYVINTLVCVFVAMIAYNIYYRFCERRALKESERQMTQLQLLLKSGNYRIWTFDVEQGKFHAVTINGESRDEYTPTAFSVYYDKDDFNRIMEVIDKIINQETTSDTFTVKCFAPGVNNIIHYFELNISILHEEYGKPTLLLGVQTDKTEERNKLINTRNNLLRFRTVFDTALAQIAYYDKDGIMTDINDSACETFGIVNKEEFLKSKMHITQVPVFHHLQNEIIDEIWVSSIVDFDELRRNGELSEYWTRRGVVYYEFTIMPIYDPQGNLMCIMSAGRDITEIATQMNRERRRSKRIESASVEINKYIENINTALEVSDTLLANYIIKDRRMEVTFDMNKPKQLFSQLECVHMVDASQTRNTARVLLLMDKGRIGKFKMRLKTRILDKQKHNVYYEVNAVPMRNNNGEITHYFCLCRNISKLVQTEKKLEEESMKAQEAERVKSSFLMNMSYEIRTPLNTVVGFAELFNAPHDKEDEAAFIEQIRSNSGNLLQLVNNILLLSRIDAKMLEIVPQPTDFGELFNASCLMGVSRGVNEGVETKFETRDEPLILEIDNAQMRHIMETLTLLSARFTQKGLIHTRYEYRNGQLTFSIKDTGAGMDKACISRILKREYNQGMMGDYNVELELTICNELAKLMGGQMEIQSIPNRGTTIWVTLPCKNLLEELENNTANGI